jgi:hypothetical protein
MATGPTRTPRNVVRLHIGYDQQNKVAAEIILDNLGTYGPGLTRWALSFLRRFQRESKRRRPDKTAEQRSFFGVTS